MFGGIKNPLSPPTTYPPCFFPAEVPEATKSAQEFLTTKGFVVVLETAVKD